MAARDSPSVPRTVARVVAEERSGTSRGLHLKYVDETAAVFRLRRSGVIQQPGGELDAPRSSWTQKLAARGQCAGRSQSGGNSFGDRILPKAGRTGEGLPRRRPARIESKNTLRSCPSHPRTLVRSPKLSHLGWPNAYSAPANLCGRFELGLLPLRLTCQ